MPVEIVMPVEEVSGSAAPAALTLAPHRDREALPHRRQGR
jgi:hypothetical protein